MSDNSVEARKKKNGGSYFKPVTKKCEYCGKMFLAKSSRQKYCGEDYKKCVVCGNVFLFSPLYQKNKQTCSKECEKKLREKTVEKQYGDGIHNVFQTSEVKEKSKETLIQKYGEDHYSKTDEFKKRYSQTMNDKYGGIGFSSEEIRSKIESTNLEKFGCANPGGNEDVQKKIENTMKEKYGGYTFSSEVLNEKVKETLQEKYGVDHYSQSSEYDERMKLVNQEKYGVDYYFQSQECRDKLNDVIQKRIEDIINDPVKFEEFKKFQNDPATYIQETFQEKPTLSDIVEKTGVTISTISSHIIKYGCQNLVKKQVSRMEDEVVEFLYSLDSKMNIVRNTKSIIPPQEIDIYLPDYRIGIECDPTYFHNSSTYDCYGGEPKSWTYHKQKSLSCMDKDVFLFHIFGWEWTSKKGIIKSMLKNLLGHNDEKYFARKLKIKELDSEECDNFLNENHRQGTMSSKVRLGLVTKDDELISVMTFNKMRPGIGQRKYDTNDTWELSRFCSKINTNVVGGASKLFNYFLKIYNPEKVVSFSDVAHTRGNLYSNLGFEFVSLSDPGYLWVHLDTDIVVSRERSQKQNLKKLFCDDTIDIENSSEKEIMESHGFVKVFDCGVVRWEF